MSRKTGQKWDDYSVRHKNSDMSNLQLSRFCCALWDDFCILCKNSFWYLFGILHFGTSHCLYLEMRNSKSLSLKNIGQNGFFTSRGVNFLLEQKHFFGSFMEKMKVEGYLVKNKCGL